MRKHSPNVVLQVQATATLASLGRAVEECVWGLCAATQPASMTVEVSLALSSFAVFVHGQGWTEQEMVALYECARQRDSDAVSSFLVRGVGGAARQVVVTSRHAGEASTRCVRFGVGQGGSPWIGHDAPRAPGITVRVSDLFCNVPVRKAAAKARPSVEWERIRTVVCQFALAFPQGGNTTETCTID